MSFFIGIVPPSQISNDLLEIQKLFGDNRLEPHITIRPPVVLKEETNWIKAIEKVASSFTSFNVELTNTGYFGKGVLFIEAASGELVLLHSQLIKALEPFEQKKPKDFKERALHPHLTLGRLWCGFTKEGFIEMEKLAKNYLMQQVSFNVEFIRIYYKPTSKEKYRTLQDVPLNTHL